MIIIFLIFTVINGDVNVTNNNITYIIKNSRVWVIEKYNLPYEMHIRHIFITPPNGTVTSALVTETSTFLFTDNHYEWEYKRFKLRHVLYNNSPKLQWNILGIFLSVFLKNKVCSYLLKL